MDGKGLEVNVEKTKVMRYRKGGRRWKKVVWKRKRREIEEVRKFKYLGYMENERQKKIHEGKSKERSGGHEGGHRGWGKRRFEKDWARRLWLFDRLVWGAVMEYGMEI